MSKFIALYGIALIACGIMVLTVYSALTLSPWCWLYLLVLPLPIAMFIDIWRTK